jgi:hypothetical protein
MRRVFLEKDELMNLEINAEQIIEQAASRLADEAYENVNALEMLEAEISRRIDKFLGETASKVMEDTLRREMKGLMVRKFQPVNQWGERQGAATSLRDELQNRAAEFWQVRVDKEGKPASYGGEPRHQHMFKVIAQEQFAAAITENIDVVIEGFRNALRQDAAKMLGEHIEKFIKSPSKKR